MSGTNAVGVCDDAIGMSMQFAKSHRRAGKLVFEHAVFRHEASDQRLVLYSPLAEEDTQRKLAELLERVAAPA